MKKVNCFGQEQKRHTYSMLNMATETTSMKSVMWSVGLADRKLVGSHASDSKMNVVLDTKMVAITTTEISFAKAGCSLKSGFSNV